MDIHTREEDGVNGVTVLAGREFAIASLSDWEVSGGDCKTGKVDWSGKRDWQGF